ncbi:MAG TPA: inositol monophosphatase family protein [Longimicrobiaceae bacterium]|nr:inositol monophosphatase family protein [Longimicrobiaceae bacterium]
MSFEAELRTAHAAAADAAELLVRGSGTEDVREKARADLVTSVDMEAEAAIIRRISAHFPDDVIIAEESESTVSSSGRRWIVDPLDGTVNFVHGHPFACVSIALVDDGGPAAGVVNAPFLREVYHATRGGGAYLNGKPLRVSAVTDGARSLLATGFPFKPGKGDPETYFRLVADLLAATHGVRRAGAAALDLAYVAAGRVDAFFELGLAPWDMAAGLLLVTEAGGEVGGWPGDSSGPLITGRLVASNGHIHDWLSGHLGRYEF